MRVFGNEISFEDGSWKKNLSLCPAKNVDLNECSW